MSVLINGMEMPKNCGRCFLRVGQCSKRIYMENRPSDCPLLALPDKHGRLIDAYALLDDVRRHSESYFADDFAHEWVDKAPTIIPAEEDE